MMNLQRKTLFITVVTLLILAGSLASSIRWLLNRELAPILEQSAVEPWPRLMLLIYLTTFALSALVGLLALLTARQWIFRPLQRFADHINRIGTSNQLSARMELTGSNELVQLAQKLNGMLDRLEIFHHRAQQYRSVVQQEPASIALFDAATHRVLDANDAFLGLTGYNSQTVSHCSLYDLCCLPRPEIDHWCLALLTQTMVQTREIRIATQCGTLIDAEVSAIYLQGGEHALYCLIVRDLTAQKRAKAALLNTIPDSYIHLKTDGTYLDAHIGRDIPPPYQGSALIGRNLYEVLPQPIADLFVATMQRAVQTGQVESCEYDRTINGVDLRLEARIAQAATDEVVAIVRNVTARRQAEATIRYQASLVESVSDVIVSTDLELRIISWNRAATTIYGYSLAEVVGRHLREVICFEFSDSNCDEAIAILRATGKWEGEQTHRRRDGALVQIWSSISYLYDSEGRQIGTVGVHRDITERKQAERLLPLAQQSESLRLLAGGIAHDFNNILSSILSQITLGLWQLPSDSKAADHLTKAARSTERAAELTRQLLAYTGQGAFLVETLHLTQYIQDNMKLLTTLVPGQAQLVWHLQPQNYTINIDRGHAQQVLINLAINAAEALPATGGQVRIETGELTLAADDARTFVRNQRPTPGQYLYLRVSDTGIGMSEAMLDLIFEPYYSTKENSSGLGLAATLGIVRHYGGGLQVESKEGQGSTFTVLLPAAAPYLPADVPADDSAVTTNAPTTVAAQFQPAHQPHADEIGATVMVVDDEMPIREALYDLLSSEGMHVLLAADGYEGVALYRTHQQEIDLILLDMKMPGLNGAQTLVALREIDPTVKVIFCSGYSEAEALRSIGEQPVVAFLQKPIEINLLLKTIRSAVH